MIKTMLNDGCIIILNPMTNNPMTDKTYLTHFIPWSNLVGGLEHFFHILGIIIPTDEFIFFRGVGQPPTSIPWSNDGMFIFNSYLTFAQRVNLHFPMLFLCFSYGFPMVFLWFSYGSYDQMMIKWLVRRLTGRPGVPLDVFGWAQRHGWEKLTCQKWWFNMV